MKIYVKVSDTDKPYLSGSSTEALDGYTSIEGLTNDQAIAALSRPNKCYVDDNGVLIVPNQIPLSQAEKDAQDMQLQFANMQKQIKDMQADITALSSDKASLQDALNKANTENANLKKQLQDMQKQAMMYTQQIMQINNDLAQAKAKGGN